MWVGWEKGKEVREVVTYVHTRINEEGNLVCCKIRDEVVDKIQPIPPEELWLWKKNGVI